MEAVVFILIVVFLAMNGKSKKKPRKGTPTALRAERADQAQTVREAVRPMPVAPEKPKPPAKVNRASLNRLQEQARKLREEFAAEVKPLAALSQEERRARLQELKAGKAARRAQAQPVAAPAFAGSDEEGCVGGSIAHEHHEGENRSEHARHNEAVKRREAEELLERAEAEDRAQSNLRRLREAVVMAEVLDRPVALRKRSLGRRAG